MKKRNIIAILFTLVCFAVCQELQAAQDTPDPGSTCALCTADGTNALANATGSANSAFGWFSLFANADGSSNTGLGAGTLLSNVSGQADTAIGTAALLFNTGSFNTALGAAAGINNDTGSNNIYIGDAGFPGESNLIAIGASASSGTAYTDTYIGGVFGAGVDATTAVPVFVDGAGKLGTVLVADAPGRQRTQPQAMLNKSDHRKLQELQGTVVRQQKEIAMLTTQLKEQAAQIQKVSAQLEVNKPAPQVVANKP
jgi:hypothetical protein